VSAERRYIEVWADWVGLGGPTLVGHLFATASRGGEIFSFEYDPAWLDDRHVQVLDPGLGLYPGPQYPGERQPNFGLFLDSSPDRWGRVLMDRREAQLARTERRDERRLRESDYLLGVHDGHRMGALRFRTSPGGPFLDDQRRFASPPWTSLRELEQASLALEREDAAEDPDYARWLRLLIAPGGSLGGARPKVSVRDPQGRLWIAKFPSRRDGEDIGAWEAVVHELATRAGIDTVAAQVRRFGSDHHTFLARRFDRGQGGERLHFASAMTMLQRTDGDHASTGASYLELAEFLIGSGVDTGQDLEQLWRRIVFFVLVSNTDDHLRNHGFLMEPDGWALAPAYDMNPEPHGAGLKLNISETDNALDLDLTREVAPWFRVTERRAARTVREIAEVVAEWRAVAERFGLGPSARDRMAPAFALADR